MTARILRRLIGKGRGDVCCSTMEEKLACRCDVHEDPFDCADVVVVRHRDDYGIPIHDGGSSFIVIRHCPWCGARLG